MVVESCGDIGLADRWNGAVQVGVFCGRVVFIQDVLKGARPKEFGPGRGGKLWEITWGCRDGRKVFIEHDVELGSNGSCVEV